MPTYKCVVCSSMSEVSDAYLKMKYVQAQCCSVHCANKLTNPQTGVEHIDIMLE